MHLDILQTYTCPDALLTVIKDWCSKRGKPYDLAPGRRMGWTKKLKVFHDGHLQCKGCGKKARLARIERVITSKGCGIRLAFYIGEPSAATLLTLDHIVPRSKGGTSEASNLTPMCFGCNIAKGNKIDGGINEDKPKQLAL